MFTQSEPTDPPVRLLAAFNQAFPDDRLTWLIKAPGRDVWIAAARASDAQFTIVEPESEIRATFNLQSAKLKLTATRRPLPRWARYPAGVTLRLAKDGLDVIGLKMVFVGDEPAGPRYDHALGMAFAALWHDLYELSYTVDTLIEIADRTRREYVEE